MADRLERLVNLTATLLDTRRALTLEELADRVEPRYPEELSARRRAFERDKDTLRELGVPIRVETLDGFGSQQAYRIHPDDYYLPDLGLSDEELAALHLAVSAVPADGDEARAGLQKLGGTVATPDPTQSVGSITTSATVPALPVLFDAVTRRAAVTFEYRDHVRRLEPFGLVARWGHWYVVGHDLDRGASRAFRVDRIDGVPEVGESNGFVPPDDLDPAALLRDDPLSYGEDEPIDARVLVDAGRSAWVVEQLGETAVRERRDDGSIVVGLAVVNRDAFRSWLLDLLDHAEVLAPEDLRAEFVAWLDQIAGAAP